MGLQDNKAIATSFLTTAINDRDPRGAVERYLGSRYVQHNPLGQDGSQGFVAWAQFALGRAPEMHVAIKRVIAEGDLVAVHHHVTDSPDDRGRAVVDIFRIDDGRIVEHWDTIQPVPETANNANGMF